MSELYLIRCEVRFVRVTAPGSEGLIGAFVVCGVNAANSKDAEAKTKYALLEDGYAIVEIEWIEAAENLEWDDKEGAREAKDIARQIKKTPNDVVYGVFESYGH